MKPLFLYNCILTLYTLGIKIYKAPIEEIILFSFTNHKNFQGKCFVRTINIFISFLCHEKLVT